VCSACLPFVIASNCRNGTRWCLADTPMHRKVALLVGGEFFFWALHRSRRVFLPSNFHDKRCWLFFCCRNLATVPPCLPYSITLFHLTGAACPASTAISATFPPCRHPPQPTHRPPHHPHPPTKAPPALGGSGGVRRARPRPIGHASHCRGWWVTGGWGGPSIDRGGGVTP
jgi:hypothetical protein